MEFNQHNGGFYSYVKLPEGMFWGFSKLNNYQQAHVKKKGESYTIYHPDHPGKGTNHTPIPSYIPWNSIMPHCFKPLKFLVLQPQGIVKWIIP